MILKQHDNLVHMIDLLFRLQVIPINAIHITWSAHPNDPYTFLAASHYHYGNNGISGYERDGFSSSCSWVDIEVKWNT